MGGVKMYVLFSRFFATGRILTGVALLVLLAGCGNTAITNQQGVAQPTGTSVNSTPVNSTPVGEPSPPQSLLAPNPSGVYQLNDPVTNSPLLQIDANYAGPITCTVDYDVGTNVVLATNRLTYDTGEIQLMANALGTNGTAVKEPLPSTLQTVSGDTAGLNIPSWGDLNHGFANAQSGGCSSAWAITNLGNDPIQITQIQVRFARDSQANNYHYRLIDVCSLPGVPDPSAGGCEHTQGAGAEDHTYIFHMKPGSQDTSPIQGEITNQFFLDSGATAKVAVIFLPADSSSYQIYSIIPEVVVDDTANGSTFTLSVPQLTSTISFIPPGNLSCYQLHGNTFTPIDMTGPSAGISVLKVFCL
jgi:hypothetical protein